MEDERRDSNGTIGEGQKPGALKIYDGALSEGFSDDLIEIFNTNEKAHTRNQNDTLNFLEYNYTTNHKDEDVHKRLMEHTGQLYKHFLEDLGTTNMIKASGFAVLINSIRASAGVDGERLNVVKPFETKNESSTLHPKL